MYTLKYLTSGYKSAHTTHLLNVIQIMFFKSGYKCASCTIQSYTMIKLVLNIHFPPHSDRSKCGLLRWMTISDRRSSVQIRLSNQACTRDLDSYMMDNVPYESETNYSMPKSGQFTFGILTYCTWKYPLDCAQSSGYLTNQ